MTLKKESLFFNQVKIKQKSKHIYKIKSIFSKIKSIKK